MIGSPPAWTNTTNRSPGRIGSPGPRSWRGSPARLEDRLGAWRLVEQGSAVLERVLLRDRGEFVDKALYHEDVVRGPDATPECSRNSGWLLADVLDADVGQCVG